MTQPSVPAAGSFRVDLDRAPRAIADLRTAREEIQALRDEAVRLGKVTPPGADSVSLDAATVLGAAAVGGPGSLLEALSAGLAHIDGLIESLEADLNSYRSTELLAARTLDGH